MDQVSGRKNSSIFSMMVRRTCSSSSELVSALPSSRNTVTSPAGRPTRGAARLRRRSMPSKLFASDILIKALNRNRIAGRKTQRRERTRVKGATYFSNIVIDDMQSALEMRVTTRNIAARIDTPLTAAYIELRAPCKQFREIPRQKAQLHESGAD